MIEFRPFEVADIHLLDVQPSQVEDRQCVLADPDRYALETSWSWTAWENARPLGMGGIITAEGGAAMSWALLSKDLRRQMPQLVRYLREALRAYVDKTGHPVYTEVDDWVFNGVRWAKLLGFERITRTQWGFR